MDVFQILFKRDGTERKKKNEQRNGWKTFHLDTINDLRLLEIEEIREIFQLKSDLISDTPFPMHLIKGFKKPIDDFVMGWNG